MSKKFEKTTKQPNRRIMLDQESKDYLYLKQQEYKLSYSTITEILITAVMNTLNSKKVMSLKSYYLNKELKQTTIKPRNFILDITNLTNAEKTILTSNILYLWTHNKMHTIFEKEEIQKFKNRFNSERQKRKEAYWNLNNEIRTQKRALRMLGAL